MQPADLRSIAGLCETMEVEFLTEGVSEEDAFGVDEINDLSIEDYSNFNGELCGICMDIVIDRGVLDCCQHWFCFACIDNWATITNLCPLCQIEFQLITCVPVYDTIGGDKADDDSYSGDDDWCIEGQNNTLSFPSYYIDENAVVCLDGDGCKIRSGSATTEDFSNLDTSIACDSCDIWYHAFCVGFDPEGTCENSWLCPGCIVDEKPQELNEFPVSRPSNQQSPEKPGSQSVVEASFCGKVSVSVADAGETAIVISMVEENQRTEESSGNLLSTSDVQDPKMDALIYSPVANNCELEMLSSERISIEPKLEPQELELSLSQETPFSLPSNSLVVTEISTPSDDQTTSEPSVFDKFKISPRKSIAEPYNDEPLESGLDLHLGLSLGSSMSVDKINNCISEDQAAGDVQQNNITEEYLLPADKIVPNKKVNVVGITRAKRKLKDRRSLAIQLHLPFCAEDEETKNKIETKVFAKKVKAERGQAYIPVSDDSQKFPSRLGVSKEGKLRCTSGKENANTSIMDIVKGADRKHQKRLTNTNLTDTSSKERENVAGLRVKKIMRRAAEDNESSLLLQNLRKEIREAVRTKSSKEFGEDLFDQKLLAAFRVAVTGPMNETKKPPLDVKAKKSLLQKGKVRENLTKRIYGIGGRRRKAWTRDCEIEFWKHRCLKVTKPEKIQTLKSVLDLLRKSSESTEIKKGNEGEATSSILSRLYVADTSVLPRKDDIKPLSAINVIGIPEQEKVHTLMGISSTPPVNNRTAKTPLMNEVSAQVGVPLVDFKGVKSSVTSISGEAAGSKVHPSKCTEKPPASTLGGSKVNFQKEMVDKSDDLKSDKKKWALEVLARKAAITGKNATHEKQEDNVLLKGNYPLLAQLPVEMRPVLAPSRHNKISLSIRQVQLYRLTEHFLKKANLHVIRRMAETELAVVDAVNIEKEVADKSNSKLVYVNLCSQEILRRSDNSKYGRATESIPSPTSAVPAEISENSTNNLSSDSVFDEALRNAGLLPDSPPNSPHHQMEEMKEKVDPSKKIEEEEPRNVFEMDSQPELDIYGDFEYDLEDEDFIGASALKISRVQPEEESKMKVVFSTLNSDRSNDALNTDDHQGSAVIEVPKASGLLECNNDTSIKSSTVNNMTDKCLPQSPLVNEGGDELSLAECDELYGPDKEPLVKKFPDRTSTKPFEPITNKVFPNESEHHGSKQEESGGQNSPSGSQTGENVPRKEKLSNIDTKKQPGSRNSVLKKVEAYIKEHIRPLCKSGVISVEQYRWAVGKTTEKVMKYHSKDKNANFLIKEGEKVKKLAEQYVETSQQTGKN